ncbi:hypothetical protein DQ04_00061370 [Trypanosoma grayi]|uniref:hypothetical protein n=1 Tax=Trypanosoma grayi TaxID=71804 RepID=UPI0004F49DB4|nr:hypothetical protein DQ04_00061370 [Trypanosoma grayi]KEG15499.1 hypothetical protein DQ04_00061370 [Trypanosoma grayi]
MEQKGNCHESGLRDAFTTALLRHAAKNLGVQYTGVMVQPSGNDIVNELDRTRSEIHTRERLLGVENMTLIPLLVKAGDLSLTREAALIYYQKALDVVEANIALKGDSTAIDDVIISSCSDLALRFFRHGQYKGAKSTFEIAISICHQKCLLESGTFLHGARECNSVQDNQKLQGKLREWQGGVEAAQQDVATILSSAAPKSLRRRGVRDSWCQTGLTANGGAGSPRCPAGLNRRAGVPKGIRDARDLEKLVEYVFDPASKSHDISTQTIVEEVQPQTFLQPAPAALSNPLPALWESTDRVSLKTYGTPTAIGLTDIVARRIL